MAVRNRPDTYGGTEAASERIDRAGAADSTDTKKHRGRVEKVVRPLNDRVIGIKREQRQKIIEKKEKKK